LGGKAAGETSSDYGGFQLEQHVHHLSDSAAALWHPAVSGNGDRNEEWSTGGMQAAIPIRSPIQSTRRLPTVYITV
jgi:hypothetical protein